MTDLTEVSEFTAGVLQLETTTPALGGPGGVMNSQAQALANRTKYLNDQLAAEIAARAADVDAEEAARIAGDSALSAEVAAADAALRADLASTLAGKGASLVALAQGGTVQDAIAYVTPEMFGAVGDGVTDDSAAILAAFNAVRVAGEGSVVFSEKIYSILYGFLVPSNCAVYLNGCTLFAADTWGQGVIPTNGTSRAVLAVAGSLTLGQSLTEDVENVSIFGCNAVIDMDYYNQTGSPPGAIGITVETTPAPIVGNLWRTHDIIVRDLTIKNAMWYGTYIEGAKDVQLENVTATMSANLGHVVVSGWNVTYTNCAGNLSQERVSPQGAGFWNEADHPWQILRNIQYFNCTAEYNRKSGFRYYNDGQDVEVSVFAHGNISRFNRWDIDTETQVTGPDAGGHVISKTGAGIANLLVVLNDCLADEEYESGFLITRSASVTDRQRIILESVVARNCNKTNLDSYITAPISILGAQSSGVVEIRNPTVIAPTTNTLGYGIGVLFCEGVFVSDPQFVGTFTYKTIAGNLAGLTRKAAGLDVGYDDSTGHIGGGTKHYRPVRFASFDQTAEPVAGTDTFTNEIIVWQDDSNQFTAIYTPDDASGQQYLDFRSKKRARVTFSFTGVSVAANTVQSGTVAVTGAVLGDMVQFSINTAQSASLLLSAAVTAAGTVTWKVANPTAAPINSINGTGIVIVESHF